MKYETVIGLEVHVQLSTESKAFCGDEVRFGSEPNTHISPVSLAYPGTLPRLNKKQVEYAIRLGLALGSEINLRSTFDRKSYFYADLPKGYQITQDNRPICIGGALEIRVGEELKKIRIHHIHMEEDAGKSIHTAEPNKSLIDLNRAGTPLLEVVTEPDLRSADEVDAFMSAMRQLVRYLEISDGNMEQGSMRCDCNVSVRPEGSEKYGERCEVKNLNSMRFARKAVEYESKRQIELIKSGGKVKQQTLDFLPDKGITLPLRSKEDAHDYRYFPEPDLPPVVLSEAYVERVKAALPQLPKAHYKAFREDYGLSTANAALLSEEKELALFYRRFCKQKVSKKAAANLMINKILPACQEKGININDFPVSFEQLTAFIDLTESGKVSSAIAYQRIFPVLVENPSRSPLKIAASLNLLQSADEGFLENLIKDALEKYPDKVSAYQKGKKGLLGFFMGEVMKNSKGKADPKKTNQLLRQKLDEDQ